MKEREDREPTIIEILDEEMRKGSNDPDYYPTVQEIARRAGVDIYTLAHWADTDHEFREGLKTVKETLDNSPWKDKPGDEVKLNSVVLAFGISLVLEETKKRYTV